MDKLIEKRLSLFGRSAMFLLAEWDSSLKRTVDFSLSYGIDTLIKINQQQWYGLFFTPNWNLWLVNKPWDWAKALHAKKDCEEYVASLYVDIDLKDTNYGSLDKLMKVTLETIFTDKIPVQYITKSWWGLHLYTFVKEAERYTVGQAVASKLTEIQENFAKIFEWWCMNSHSINKLMRLPFSKYWRTIPPKDITLYKVRRTDTNIELDLVTDESQIVLDESLCIWEEHVMNFINNTAEIKTVKNRWTEYIWDIGSAQINSIPIEDIIEKLKAYPRTYQGKTYEFSLKGTRINLKIDGRVYVPDGYKLNKDKNYVHNFSLYEHPSEERPRWPAFVFMYNYFNKDITALNNFLSKEYDISLSKWWEGWENYICLPTETWYIYFTDKWVFYSKSVFNKKAKTYEDMQIKLFDMPIYIKWIIKTSYDLFWETEDENIFYILYSPKKELEILLEYCTDRKAFNKKYWKKWLIFLWSEFDLIDLYNAINKAAEWWVIKTFDLRYLNGYYPDCYIKWEDVYDRYGKLMDITDSNIILKTQSIPHTNDSKEISMQEFWERLCKVFSPRLSMLSYTTFLALLLWHKFWVPMLKNYKQQVLLPWLFLSGITKSWKTTLLTILKNWADITLDARKYSIVGTSAQPLKQAATDDFILHIEEFTWQIWDAKETILRDIMNKAKTGRGMADGNNVFYIFRSSLILDWEHMPRSESVANRCIVVPMFDSSKDKIGSEKTLSDMISISYLKDFISKTYEYKPDDVLSIFKSSETTLKKNGIWDRNLLLYSFLLTVNRMFSIYIEEELIQQILDNIALHNTIDKENNVLWNLLSELIIKNKIAPTLTEKEDYWQITIPYTMDIRWQNKIMFIDVTQQYANNIKIIWSNINIKLFTEKWWVIARDKANIDIYNIILPYKSYFKVERFLDFIETDVEQQNK